ncbi:hypothetical protein GCM10010493_74690 [Streptomyces lavendulae subsp. grasserius]
MQVDADLKRVKHFLWHGDTFRALALLDSPGRRLRGTLRPGARPQAMGVLDQGERVSQRHPAQRRAVPQYGERHRSGEPLSSASAESAVDQVISPRMVKKQ